ncbi:glucose-1-phosphate cytidylyltransferase [Candidatus Pelagibacter sp. IMCC9063]|uniref:sugar phosphate nucleotidyltransferase n=1 Tax=Pelagibacter sp. (strain IMCC9063) TaxID=1002672 RepID=UPI000204646C|nr:sugar phosphate nucleotidyltransferase [Candidatus Pelagibacter sp. IMCC9063]AEA80557.1 glucose-1-phosphate cytidylyltransferase [Candidatus Pelagibacter sp. IMCC9063]|tara:strand:- start:14046 stop:14753 length:708 start_codon:yes stop_codon:yes gene_type:complete
MKVVILCGGLGSRLSEETKNIPKPMVRVGSRPIVCHIINIYKKYGIKDFILLSGYKSNIIKSYFKKEYKDANINVKVHYTGKLSQTGGRLLRVKFLLDKEEFFLMTYGDGVADINIKKLISFHIKNKKTVTVTAVKPPVRFGELTINKNQVVRFDEKIQSKSGWISGGFFVVNRKIFKFLKNDTTVFEKEPINKLVKQKQLSAYKHKGFWQCMDTLRDKKYLVSLLRKGKAKWIK